MMNPLVPEKDWSYYLAYTRARVLVTTRAFAEANRGAVAARVRQGLRLCVVDDPVEQATLSGMAETCAFGDTVDDDAAVWLFSSGSTGDPKACIHSSGDFVFNTEHYARQVLGLRESDRTLSVPKLFFGYATGTNLMFPWAVGATACLFRERATPETVLEKIRVFSPTILTNVPTMIHRMLEHADAATTDLSSIRLVLSAGEALPAELYRRWVERTGVEILDGIGSAELFHIYISNRPGDVRIGTLGRLVPGYDARIVGADELPVPLGEIGTLWVRGPSNAIGYHQDRARSRATFRGEWTTTGDQFRVDADGYYVYCGRADDLIKVGGVYVAPTEVENCLLTHPAVREVAVVGFLRDGLMLTAAVVVTAGASQDEHLAASIQEHVKQRLSPHKYPRVVRFAEVLPRNDRAKVARSVLRRQIEAQDAAGDIGLDLRC